MSWPSFDGSPARALALAVLLGAGLPACSSGDSGSNTDAGIDASTTADAGGTDATTGIDSANGGDAATDTGAAAADAGNTTPDTAVPPASTVCLADGGSSAFNCCDVQKPLPATTTTIVPRAGATGGQYTWADPGGFNGYSYTYGSNGQGMPTIASDVSGGSWHLTGSIANYSGLGLGFGCMVDASPYAGIKFTIGGNIGEPVADGGTVSHLTFVVSTAATDFQDQVTTSYARCIPVTGNQYDGTCVAARATVTVSPTATTYSFLWGDLTGGRTVINRMSVPALVNPAEITSLSWTFDWVVTNPDGGLLTTPDGGPGYPLDITISDVSFITSATDGGPNDGAAPDGSSDASADGSRSD